MMLSYLDQVSKPLHCVWLTSQFFTGEKVVPIPQEGYLGSLPFVAGVVMFGRGKNQVGVLIEPKPDQAVDPKDEKALIEFRNKIWYGNGFLQMVGPC